MKRPMFQALSSALQARENCHKLANRDWFLRHEERLNSLMETAPSGSGIDNGTALDWEKSTAERLVFVFGFHHMDENGCYDGWTEHTLVVTPSLLSGLTLRITGRDRNDVKSYLHDVYFDWLTSEAD